MATTGKPGSTAGDLTDWGTSEEWCARMRARLGPTIGFLFSNGKDSVGAWIMLRRYFEDIRPAYHEVVPGLRFIDESLSHYEKFFGAKILRLPGDSLIEWIENLSFMTWAQGKAVSDLVLHRGYRVHQLNRVACRTWGLDYDSTWFADGVRRSDSLQRAIMLKKQGPANEDLRLFSCIFDWSASRLEQEIRDAGCGLPVDYELFGRSLDSIRVKFLGPIRDRFPDDYERILKWFPLAEVELLRYEESLRSGVTISAEELAEMRKAAGNREDVPFQVKMLGKQRRAGTV